jgi:ATP-dependent Lon protease
MSDLNGVGTATGLAWSQHGGDILPVEVQTIPGETGLQLTGQLGSVMQESAQAAYSYVRAHADALGIPKGHFLGNKFHVHVPDGAMPKDGPSAGITMVTALASEASGRAVIPGLAMTGEVTLKGNVGQIGGLKEKIIAAERRGYKTIIIPKTNSSDLEEIPKSVRDNLTIIPVSHVSEVLNIALTPIEPKTEKAGLGFHSQPQ